MLEKKTWVEFRDSGLLWWINRTLHLFGWAIVVKVDESTGNIFEIYPAKCRFRGFCDEDEAEGFRKLTQHLRDNIDDIQQSTL